MTDATHALAHTVRASPGTIALAFAGAVVLIVGYHGAKHVAGKLEGMAKNASANLKQATMASPATAGAAPAANNGGF
jgi:hypothetical protein